MIHSDPLTPKVGFCKMGLALSPDGRCKTFDESANGFTRADGAGSIVLDLAGEAQKANWLRMGELLCLYMRGFSLTQSRNSNGSCAKKKSPFESSNAESTMSSIACIAPEWKARAGHGPWSLCESGALCQKRLEIHC